MYDISNSPHSKQAKNRLEAQFASGTEEQDKLIEQVASMHIIDKLVPPSKMQFEYFGGPSVAFGGGRYGIHKHALGQMCGVAGMPRSYATRLLDDENGWSADLFDRNMNDLFHHEKYLDRSRRPTKFLHRIVGGEVRGFLSRNFNRHLASLPLLRGFVIACERLGARATEAGASHTRFSLKCFLPHVFEPVPGEFVAFGMTWGNSDFGAGRMRVALCSQRIASGTVAIMDDVLSRVHIGSIIQDSDLEVSNETAAKEVDAQVSAIHDAVNTNLSEDAVNNMLNVITKAYEEEIPWHRLKNELGALLQKGEVQNIKNMLSEGADDIVDLPPPGKAADGSPIATRWWASNVLGWMSGREAGSERRDELQQLAGNILRKSA